MFIGLQSDVLDKYLGIEIQTIAADQFCNLFVYVIREKRGFTNCTIAKVQSKIYALANCSRINP